MSEEDNSNEYSTEQLAQRWLDLASLLQAMTERDVALYQFLGKLPQFAMASIEHKDVYERYMAAMKQTMDETQNLLVKIQQEMAAKEGIELGEE